MLESVHSPDAPKAIGPYSQAVRAGDFLFCSGQIPLDPQTGELVPNDVAAQTRRVMENIRAVLASASATFSSVAKTTIYLVDMNDFATVNEIYGSYFSEPFPARSTVAVAALPRGSRVEIEVIAEL